jgi:hypothetical protein
MLFSVSIPQHASMGNLGRRALAVLVRQILQSAGTLFCLKTGGLG